MGDEIPTRSGLLLEVETPIAGNIKVIHNGKVIKEEKADHLTWPAALPGVYRVEVWLPVDGEMRPWIYSNAIRVSDK